MIKRETLIDVLICMKVSQNLRRLMLILLLMFIFSICTTQCQPSSDQGIVNVKLTQDKMVQPFNVFGDINYTITVYNIGPSDKTFNVDLTVGPDIKRRDIKQDFKTEFGRLLTVPARGSNSIVFKVNFGDFDEGEFQKWYLNNNETANWENAWYKVVVKQWPFGESIPSLQNYESAPLLGKPCFNYSEPKVFPPEGTNRTLYTYQVKVMGCYKDNITLKVSSREGGEWRAIGEPKPYSTPSSSQYLNWENVSLNSEFDVARFMFSGIKDSAIIKGPVWPLQMDSRNAEVEPKTGLSKDTFNYSLEVNSSKRLDIGLNELDPATGQMKLAGISQYTNVSSWQRLYWSNLRASDNEDAEGKSEYYFTFYRDGSPFNQTARSPGPNLATVFFKDPRVTPSNGTNLEPYRYCVNIYTTKSECNVILQTKNPDEDSPMMNRGEKTFKQGQNKTLCWTGVRLDNASEVGNASFRFVTGRFYSEEYPGPSISTCMKPELKLMYSPLVLLGEGGTAIQKIHAELENVDKRGKMKIEVMGPDLRFQNIAEGLETSSGLSYSWDINFSQSNIGKSYKMLLKYIYPNSECGEYSFEEKSMYVTTLINKTCKDPLLNLTYEPVLMLGTDGKSVEHIKGHLNDAEVKGKMRLLLIGSNLEYEDVKEIQVAPEGQSFDWEIPFNESNQNKTYKMGLSYIYPDESCGEYSFGDRFISIIGKQGGGFPIEPSLDLRYDDIVYLAEGQEIEVPIAASIISPYDNEKLKFSLSGPDKNYQNESVGRVEKRDGKGYAYFCDYLVAFNYTNAGKRYKIAISLSDSKLPGGEYRFKDYYILVNHIQVSIQNPHIAPENGSDIDRYNYYVDVNSNLNKCDLELQTASPRSNSWISKGVATWHKGDRNISWKSIDSPSRGILGMARFRVLWKNEVLGEFNGPNIYLNLDWLNRSIDYQQGFCTYHLPVKTSKNKVCLEIWASSGKSPLNATGKTAWYNRSDANESWQYLTWPNVTCADRWIVRPCEVMD